jgi:glucokinase
VLYTYDPEIIILGGMVSKSFNLFRESMYATLQRFNFAKTVESIRIEASEIDNIAIYGAASLYYDHLNRKR